MRRVSIELRPLGNRTRSHESGKRPAWRPFANSYARVGYCTSECMPVVTSILAGASTQPDTKSHRRCRDRAPASSIGHRQSIISFPLSHRARAVGATLRLMSWSRFLTYSQRAHFLAIACDCECVVVPRLASFSVAVAEQSRSWFSTQFARMVPGRPPVALAWFD